MFEYALIEFIDDKTLEVVRCADITFKNEMVHSDFGSWDRNEEVPVRWGLPGRGHPGPGDIKAYAALVLQFGGMY